jgi:catecholate siderophore receptor
MLLFSLAVKRYISPYMLTEQRMSYIKSRKHGSTRAVSPVTGLCSGAKAATVLTGLALTLPLQAQTADSSALPQVTVQGEQLSDYKAEQLSSPKFMDSLVNTTRTVTVVKEELTREQAASTLTEALQNVPGVGTFFAGENGSTSTGDAIYMRGFDSSSSIFVDGVRDLGSISRDVFNSEQVEVIKGAAGTDFGRSAPTGAINMVSKQPKLEDSFDASLGLGSARYRRATADWNKQLTGLPGAAIRLNALAQNAGVAGRDQVKNKRWALAPSLALGLGTDTRTYINLLHVKQNNVPDGGVPTIGLPGYSNTDALLNAGARVKSSNFYGTQADHDDVTADMVTLRLEHDFNADTTLRNTSRWGRTKQDYLLTSFMQLNSNGSANPQDWTVARSLPTFKLQRNEIWTNQTNLTTRFQTAGLQHHLNTGVEFTRESQRNYGVRSSGAWTPAQLYQPSSDAAGLSWERNGADSAGSTNTAAIYAFDTVELSERWQVNGGLRLDYYKTKYSALGQCGGTGRRAIACGGLPTGSLVATADGLKDSGTLFNWKVGALYRLAANGNIYVNYALSQQPPGGSNFTLSSAGNNANNPNMSPQKTRTAELGTKWEVMDKRLLLSAALFRTEVENEIYTDSDGSINQTGDKRVHGLELSAVGQLTSAWAISAGYTHQQAKVGRGSNVAQDGSRNVAYTPRDAFTLWSTYQLPFGLTLGGGARYSGGLKRGSDGAVGTPNHTSAYWVADAMAAYRVTRNLSVQFNVYNLFDKDYVASINKSGYRYFPGVERSYRLTANLEF